MSGITENTISTCARESRQIVKANLYDELEFVYAVITRVAN